MKYIETRRPWVLVFISLSCLVIGYFMLNDTAAPLPDPGSQNRRVQDIQDRLDVVAVAPPKLAQVNPPGIEKNNAKALPLNPADFALTAKDYGGHPAYGEAMLIKGCANYFESRKSHDQDLADAQKLQQSGIKEYENLVDHTVFLIRKMDVQCRGVTAQEIEKYGALMREAAAAGDIEAKSIVLREDFDAANEARVAAKLKGLTSNVPESTSKAWLAEATQLAQQGNSQAAQLAALMTVGTKYGQKDIAASAMWSMLGVQRKGEPFDSVNSTFDVEPYSQLSTAEKAIAIERAKALHAACCGESTKLKPKDPP